MHSMNFVYSAEDRAEFRDYCRSQGQSPFYLGHANYQRYLSERSTETEKEIRPAPQAASPGREVVPRARHQDAAEVAAAEAEQRHAKIAAEAERLEAEAEAERRERFAAEKMAAEKAAAIEAERQTRIAREKAEAERRREERAAAAKAAEERKYTEEACVDRMEVSIADLGQKIREGPLAKDGPEFHPMEVDIPEAHNKTTINILLNGNTLDPTQAVVLLGKSGSEVLQALMTKRIIIGQIADDEIDKINDFSPVIDEEGSMGSMLAVLEARDEENKNSDIIDAAKKCVKEAIRKKVLEKHGASLSNSFTHYSSFLKEYKPAMARNFSIYCLMNVANNVPLASVIRSETLSDAEFLADSNGFDSIDGWSIGRFVFLVAAPALAGDSEDDMEIPMKVVCEALVGLLNDDFNSVWREYGDQILLPDDDGNIKASVNAPDYFSDEVSGLARKTAIVQTITAIYQCQIIASRNKNDINVAGMNGKKLALAISRCPTADIVGKTKLLKQGNLFFDDSRKKVREAKRFIDTHLPYLLHLPIFLLYQI